VVSLGHPAAPAAFLHDKRISEFDVELMVELKDHLVARSKDARARTKRVPKVGTWLDYDPLVVLLDAGTELDQTSKRYPNLGWAAFLATLFLGGLRVSEACMLKRKDVIWPRPALRLPDSKTPSGHRDVPLLRMLFDILRAWWIVHPDPRPEAPLFRPRPAPAGTRTTRGNGFFGQCFGTLGTRAAKRPRSSRSGLAPTQDGARSLPGARRPATTPGPSWPGWAMRMPL
jgi:integrase